MAGLPAVNRKTGTGILVLLFAATAIVLRNDPLVKATMACGFSALVIIVVLYSFLVWLSSVFLLLSSRLSAGPCRHGRRVCVMIGGETERRETECDIFTPGSDVGICRDRPDLNRQYGTVSVHGSTCTQDAGPVPRTRDDNPLDLCSTS